MGKLNAHRPIYYKKDNNYVRDLGSEYVNLWSLH